MIYRIRRFGVVKTANTVALMYTVFFGVIFLIVGLIGGLAYIGGSGANSSLGLPSFLIALFIGVVVYAILGWIVTAIACVVYNAAASRTGGIQMELEQAPPNLALGWGPGGPYGGTTSPRTPPAWGGATQPQPGPFTGWDPPGSQPG